MTKTPPDSRFIEIYLPTYYYLARNPSKNVLYSQFDDFQEISDRKYSQPKIIPSKREMTTDNGIISTYFQGGAEKKVADTTRKIPPAASLEKSTYLPPRNPSNSRFSSQFDGFPEISDLKYKPAKTIPSKQVTTTDFGVISTDLARNHHS